MHLATLEPPWHLLQEDPNQGDVVPKAILLLPWTHRCKAYRRRGGEVGNARDARTAAAEARMDYLILV